MKSHIKIHNEYLMIFVYVDMHVFLTIIDRHFSKRQNIWKLNVGMCHEKENEEKSTWNEFVSL